MVGVHLSTLVEMIESGYDDRVLLGDSLTGADVAARVRVGAAKLGGFAALVYAGENHPLLPLGLLSAAWAGLAFVPVNYRLEEEQLAGLVKRQAGALVLADGPTAARLSGID